MTTILKNTPSVFIDLLFLKSGLLSAEENLEKLLSPFGIFVALDNYIKAGITRISSTDTNWRELIRILIRNAKLVVLYMGESESLLDEVGYTIELCNPNKIVFIIPNNDKKAYKTTCSRIIKEVYIHKKISIQMHSCPNIRISRILNQIHGCGFILFDKNWIPTTNFTLQKIFESNNKKVPKDKTFNINFVFKFLKIIILIIFSFVLCLIIQYWLFIQ
jgi:hypothetical protein